MTHLTKERLEDALAAVQFFEGERAATITNALQTLIDARSGSYNATETAPTWQPIETAPKDTTLILANFKGSCLLTGAPHVWTATYVTKWVDGEGNTSEDEDMEMWCECSYAATNENVEPTHWMPLPTPPEKSE